MSSVGSASSAGSAAPAESASQTSSPTATPVPSEGGGDGGLSTGAKAGIGIGVGLGVLIAIFAISFFLRRRRLHRHQHQPVSQFEHSAYPEQDKKPRPVSELPGSGVPVAGAKYEDMRSSGYESEYGTGMAAKGSSNWSSPAPTYSPTMQTGPRPAGSDRVHELG